MVECEFSSDGTATVYVSAFNRYMVECELSCVLQDVKTFYVLIDTWWNVNVRVLDFAGAAGLVLIDTWWNVNLSESLLHLPAHIVLIDTWWNVNNVRKLI